MGEGRGKKHEVERACVDFFYQLYNKISNLIGNRQPLFMGAKYNFVCRRLHKQGDRRSSDLFNPGLIITTTTQAGYLSHLTTTEVSFAPFMQGGYYTIGFVNIFCIGFSHVKVS